MRDSSATVREMAPVARGVGPGALLREARESRRMSVRAVADALHLHPDVIEALERENLDVLPPATFVKGYFRAYGKLLEIPEEELAAAVERLGLSERDPAPDISNSPATPTGRGTSVAVGLLLLVLAAAVAGGVWWLSRPAPEEAEVSTSPTSPEPTDAAADRASVAEDPAPAAGSESAQRTAPPVPDEPGVAASTQAPTASVDSDQTNAGDAAGPNAAQGQSTAQAEPGGGESAAGRSDQAVSSADGPVPESAAPDSPSPSTQAAVDSAGTPAESARTATSAAEASAVPPAADELRLVVSGDAKSWVDIRDANGERLLYGLISGPAQRSVTGTAPFTLVIGQADAVRLQYQGEDVPLGRFMRGDVARFQWPPDS